MQEYALILISTVLVNNFVLVKFLGLGSALNLNVHFHMLFLDGVYTETKYGKLRFQRINAPDQKELVALVHTISHRVAGFLEREGIL